MKKRLRRLPHQFQTPLVAAALIVGIASMASASSLRIASQAQEVQALDCSFELIGNPLLSWMKPDYIHFMAERLGANFQKQDPGMRLTSLRCLGQPKMTTTLNSDTNVVSGVALEVPLEVLLVGSDTRGHRITGVALATHRWDGDDVTGRFDFTIKGDARP